MFIEAKTVIKTQQFNRVCPVKIFVYLFRLGWTEWTEALMRIRIPAGVLEQISRD